MNFSSKNASPYSNNSTFGSQQQNSPIRNRKTSPGKGSPKMRKSTSPGKKTSPTRTQTTYPSSSNYTPTSSNRGSAYPTPTKGTKGQVNRDLNIPSTLPDFHPPKYGSVAAYKDS